MPPAPTGAPQRPGVSCALQACVQPSCCSSPGCECATELPLPHPAGPRAEGGQPLGGGVHAAGQHDHCPHGGRGLARQVRGNLSLKSCTMGKPTAAPSARPCRGPPDRRCTQALHAGESLPGSVAVQCQRCLAPAPAAPAPPAAGCARRALLRCHPPPNMHKMVELSRTAAELGFELDTSGAGAWASRAARGAGALAGQLAGRVHGRGSLQGGRAHVGPVSPGFGGAALPALPGTPRTSPPESAALLCVS